MIAPRLLRKVDPQYTADAMRAKVPQAKAWPEPMVELYTGAPLLQALLGLLAGVVLVPGTTDDAVAV